MFRQLRRLPKLATLAVVAFVAACSSDSTIAPSGARAIKAPLFTGANLPSKILMYKDTVVVEFTVGPNGGSADIGNHAITFPAATICDPSVSTYGPTEWQAPCQVIESDVTITATSWIDANGHPRIDFTPALRFTANVDGVLPTLYLRDSDAVLQDWSSIVYCLHIGSGCLNESLTDSALTTYRDPVTGFLYRFIRHFSGYNVWA